MTKNPHSRPTILLLLVQNGKVLGSSCSTTHASERDSTSREEPGSTLFAQIVSLLEVEKTSTAVNPGAVGLAEFTVVVVTTWSHQPRQENVSAASSTPAKQS
jgi:hypothetical protein